MFFNGHRLKMIQREIRTLTEMMCYMTIQIDALKVQVATTISLETQAIALIKAGGGGGNIPSSDLAQVVVATAQLKASSDALAAAMNTPGGGGGGTEASDAQSLVSLAQQAAAASTNSAEVTRIVGVMQAAVSSLSGAFTRNTPPLSSAVTQQLVTALGVISPLVSNLSNSTGNPSTVTSLASQIQNAAQSLVNLIANNPRSGTGGGGGTEIAEVQNLISLAQEVTTVSDDASEVTRIAGLMQVSAASLSGAFVRNTPPLSSSITQQFVSAIDGISLTIVNLFGVANDSEAVNTMAAQIHNASQKLATLVTANPRGGPQPVARRTGGR